MRPCNRTQNIQLTIPVQASYDWSSHNIKPVIIGDSAGSTKLVDTFIGPTKPRFD